MYFKPILDIDSEEFRCAWDLYESAFPADERRSLDSQVVLFNNKLYNFTVAIKSGLIVGFLATWRLNGFVFIEHFAVLEKLRNQGIGTKILKRYISQIDRVVLEVEKPENSLAKRRIGFYKRLGFCLNYFDGYVQPPYEAGKESVPMFLMTFPEEINGFDFQKIKSQIHRMVYGVKG